MHEDDLRRFLIDQQGRTDEDALEEAERILSEKSEFLLEDFYGYLFDSELNPPIRSSQVHHDMCAPLSHYYVYTGHNSYLTGNQLNSDSGVDPIIRALQRGVRVIELDIWPNSTNDDVHVYHGMTLTSHVELLECLEAIKEHAFSSSPYPVVLNLENHLTPDLQAKTAMMICDTFGDLLFKPADFDSMEEFPSPESLMHRIIVSAEHPEEEDPDCQNSTSAYKHIITIKDGKPKDGVENALTMINSNTVGQLNVSEPDLKAASESHGANMVRFSQKNIIRVYPKGARIFSSNYNPFIGWTHGAQMVAFNMQGFGKSLWQMQGFFKANGGCGYVKKPDILLDVDSDNYPFDIQETRPVKTTLKVKLYKGTGWQLDFEKSDFDSFSLPDFYAEVGIAGVPSDVVMEKTQTVENCWTPTWNEEFSFPLTVPELAVVHIEVHEEDTAERDEFGGHACFPVSELRPGIRSVPISDIEGNQHKSVKLLMKFELC
ncbi:Phosphoinositide phospholipase C [Zostera marina]|uniref:Phosphoinositide phospholipase C n=1 Tax=Zostera marina TaxID=29655 RepID=A0A0K9PCJ5_ZOSMR|nr:Phosphoinositide phospholipase C [Zostera marina]